MDFKCAVYATLAYSDIFDYPLTEKELQKYFVSGLPVDTTFEEMLRACPKAKKKDGYFYLAGRSGLIPLRQKRESISHEKMKRAKKIARLLQYIPSVEFIGLSGSLAMSNADTDADIDLFIITKPHTLWLTRLFMLLLLECCGMRRKRTGNIFSDTVCVNMLLDTKHLSFPKERHDFYTAHEIVQLKPLIDRGEIYEQFLLQNTWVLHFLPNAFGKIRRSRRRDKSSFYWFLPLELLARSVQVWYMKGHRTKETITPGFVAFHPFDYKKEILTQWKKKKKAYGI